MQTLEVIKKAKLRYVKDSNPGYTRKRVGRTFVFTTCEGRKVKSPVIISRLKRLAVPPAYTNVWYSKDPRGHIQAVARDSKKRKQYRYHPDWVSARDANKYDRICDFVRALPRLRAQVQKDLKLSGLPREKVLAAVVSLLEKTLIRIGNDEYAETNKSFGLTTLRDAHVDFKGASVRFKFKGKSHVVHDLEIEDPKLAKIVKKCRDLPGQELFQYLDEEGRVHDIKSDHVNEYIRQIAGEDFSAKDFRTWAGTLLASQALQEYREFSSQRDAQKKIMRAIESVAKRLGNTKAICRKCYIHPEVFSAYMDGDLARILDKKAKKILSSDLRSLRREEAAILVLLEKRLSLRASQISTSA